MANDGTQSPEGSLERLDIDVQTKAPEDILTPNAVKSLRLRKQREMGYFYGDVEAFHGTVLSSVDWYIEALHRRDGDVYTLGKELDRLEIENDKLQHELTTLRYNAPLKDAIDQQKEDREMSDLMNRLALSEQELATTRNQLEQAQKDLQEGNFSDAPVDAAQSAPDDELLAELANLQAQLSSAETAREEAEATLLATQEQLDNIDSSPEAAPAVDPEQEQALANAHEHIQSLEAFQAQQERYIDELEDYINKLENGTEEPGSTPEEAAETEVAAEEGELEEDDDPMFTSVADEPEEVVQAAPEEESEILPAEATVYEETVTPPALPAEDEDLDVTPTYKGQPLPKGIRLEDL
jgi:chromosome segregation ATPase